MKDPRKPKNMLEENKDIVKESEIHLFGKNVRSHMI